MWNKMGSFLREWEYRNLANGVLRPYSIDLEKLQEQLRAEGYASQCGQDKWVVDYLLPGKKHGVFVDIGAHDGVTFSNTLFLEREMGWTGLAVEPIPDVFEKLKDQRRCICVNGCIGAKNELSRFLAIEGYSQMLSGLVKEYHPDHIERIKKEMKQHGGKVVEIESQCYALNDLLEKHEISQIDYLTIDIEGGELLALEAFDFERYPVSIVGIENNYKDYRIPKFLNEKGYVFHSIVGDEFYVKQGF